MDMVEIRRLLSNGVPVYVQFTKDVERYETCIDEGMRARIVSVGDQDEWGTTKIWFSFALFELHNTPLMKRNYFDKDGVSCLTAKEVGVWPKDNLEQLWVMESKLTEFNIIDINDREIHDPDLFDLYTSEKPMYNEGIKYTECLEKKLQKILIF